MNLARRLAAEGLGTALLLAAIVGSGTWASVSREATTPSRFLPTASRPAARFTS
jgi:hypothetical protein